MLLVAVGTAGNQACEPGVIEDLFCGDGKVTEYTNEDLADEECDQGAGNSDTEPDACRTNCMLPYCGDGVQDTREACDDGNDVDGDGCQTDCTITPSGTFEITNVYLTPDVNVLGGVRPRFTSDMAIDLVVETSEGMTSVQAEVVSCDPAEVTDCNPVADNPLSATSWSLRLPGFVGSATGTLFTVQVTAQGSGGQVDQQTVDLEVYPVDPGLDVTCTKRYDSGSLYVAFTLVDNGSLPIAPSTGNPYTLADMFDARFWLLQEGEETGLVLDETDPSRGDFILMQPTEFNLDDDGIYEMVFTGLLGFVEPIQTHLVIDTIGGGNDVCTLVP
jgi:cysteine-rich repeat protein